MRTLQEIQDLVAQEHGYNNWPELIVLEKGQLNKYIDIACRNYADEAITAQLKAVAETAEVMKVEHFNGEPVNWQSDTYFYTLGDSFEVNEDSIIGCKRIPLI